MRGGIAEHVGLGDARRGWRSGLVSQEPAENEVPDGAIGASDEAVEDQDRTLSTGGGEFGFGEILRALAAVELAEVVAIDALKIRDDRAAEPPGEQFEGDLQVDDRGRTVGENKDVLGL